MLSCKKYIFKPIKECDVIYLCVRNSDNAHCNNQILYFFVKLSKEFHYESKYCYNKYYFKDM